MSVHPIRMIVGLGNPGAEYEATRHNAGVWFLEALQYQERLPAFSHEKKFHAMVGRWRCDTNDFLLVFPTTFMNRSGQAVAAIAKYFNIAVEEILVVHDELDHPAGSVRLKQGGGHGGHNGLRDIIQHLGKDFWRLRLGVGHPGHKHLVTDYVLHAPSKSDCQLIDDAIAQTLPFLEEILAGKMAKVMNQLHQSP